MSNIIKIFFLSLFALSFKKNTDIYDTNNKDRYGICVYWVKKKADEWSGLNSKKEIDRAKVIRDFIYQWYPRIANVLFSEDMTFLNRSIKLHYKKNFGGGLVSGRNMKLGHPYIIKKSDTGIGGVVAHELTHIIQFKKIYSFKKWKWAIEGVADYVSKGFFKGNLDYHSFPMPDKRKWDAGYQRVAGFLVWLEKKVKYGAVRIIHSFATKRKDVDDAFKLISNKTLEKTWQEYVKIREDYNKKNPKKKKIRKTQMKDIFSIQINNSSNLLKQELIDDLKYHINQWYHIYNFHTFTKGFSPQKSINLNFVNSDKNYNSDNKNIYIPLKKFITYKQDNLLEIIVKEITKHILYHHENVPSLITQAIEQYLFHTLYLGDICYNYSKYNDKNNSLSLASFFHHLEFNYFGIIDRLNEYCRSNIKSNDSAYNFLKKFFLTDLNKDFNTLWDDYITRKKKFISDLEIKK